MIVRFVVIMFFLAVIPLSVSAGDDKAVKGAYIQMPEYKFNFDGKSVDVLEFFSFYCGHCYELEKAVPVIKGNFPKKIKWKSIPVYWGKGSSKPGEAFFLAEEEGKGEQMKKAIFNAYFVEKRDIGDLAVLESLGVKLGLGFEFSRKLRAGDKGKEAKAALIMLEAYKIDETPTLVIAGNVKTNPHMVDHSMDSFRDNTITILKSILSK